PQSYRSCHSLRRLAELVSASLVYSFAFFTLAFGLALGSAFVFVALGAFAFGSFGAFASALGFGLDPAATASRAGLSRAIVWMRAMSRLICLTRAVFSSWPEAAWKRRLNCSFLSLISSSESWSSVIPRT